MANTGFEINPKEKLEVVTVDFNNLSEFPAVGLPNVYYKAISTSNLVYRFVDGDYEEISPAVDSNNNLCEDSLQPQYKRNIAPSSPKYRELNTSACPVDSGSEVTLTGVITAPEPQTGGTNRYGVKFIVSEALDNNLTIEYTIAYDDITSTAEYHSGNLLLNVGETEVETSGYVVIDGSLADTANVTIDSVSPNPNGTKTIVY